MEQSILNHTKKLLGISPDDASFDFDIIIHINSAFSTLTDLGVGPEGGFVIEDEYVKWDDYPVDDPVKLSKVKTVVYLHTRLAFDPPTVGFLLESAKAILQEAEWRLNTNRESTEWVDPTPISKEEGVVLERYSHIE